MHLKSIRPLNESRSRNPPEWQVHNAPHSAADYERMQQRPAVKKALDFEKQVQAEFAKAA